jgi:hypothetical protein
LSYGENYTYGDKYAVKTNRIAELEEGDILFFYATLDYIGDDSPEHDWINEDWGAYIIGHFTLEFDPIQKDEFDSIPEEIQEQLSTNAHFRREEFDAEYLVLGNSDESELYDTPVPLSGESGTEPNRFVKDHSHSPPGGPWYRRPLEFDAEATRAILQAQRDYHAASTDEPEVKSQAEFDRSEVAEKDSSSGFSIHPIPSTLFETS